MVGSKLLRGLLTLTGLSLACTDDADAPLCDANCTDCADDPVDCAPTVIEAQALAAIDFVEQRLLENHPRTLDGLPAEVQAAFDEARAAVEGSVTTAHLTGLLSSALASLADGHTRLDLPAETRWLDLPFVWTAQGPVITRDAGELRRGDLLVELAGHAWPALLTELAPYVSHENPHHLRAVAPTMLVRQDVLGWLDVTAASPLSLVIDRDGQRATLSLAFTDVPPAASAPQPPSYTIDEARGVAVLRLDSCVYDAAYQSALDGLLAEASLRGVDDIVVDLRQNEGGDITVAAALLTRLGRPWSAFSVEQRASEGFLAAFPVFASPDVQAALMAFGVDVAAPVWAIPGEAIAALLTSQLAPPPDESFAGSVHALIGPRTFSSAHLFAMMLRDNGLGSLFGEPSGNAASFWGQNYAIEIPDTGWTMQVATATNLRIAEETRDAATLTPDLVLELQREDVAAGEDRVLEDVLAHLAQN